jgi:hypothetical protein
MRTSRRYERARAAWRCAGVSDIRRVRESVGNAAHRTVIPVAGGSTLAANLRHDLRHAHTYPTGQLVGELHGRLIAP